MKTVGRLLLFVALLSTHGQAVLTLDPAASYQTITGWEAVAWASQESPSFPQYKDELFNRAITEAGITRLRVEVRSGAENSRDYWTEYQQGQVDYATWRASRYATVNDNSDPASANAAGFHFSELSSVIEKVVLPMRAAASSNGVALYINLNYVAFTSQITSGAYHHSNPAEYAEFMLAAFQHIDRHYGFVPDALEILLEPDNVSQWNGNLLGRAIVATASRLRAAGYRPQIIAPSCTSMANAISWFDALVQVSGALTNLSEYSYHRYSGVSDANLQAIANRAKQRGLQTSMLEWWSDSNGHAVLYSDLVIGNNSAWEHGVLGGPGNLDNSMTLFVINTNTAPPSITLNRKARLTRQYYRFVRPGAVRIGAQSGSATFAPLAFRHPNGDWTVVVKATAAGSFAVRGLPAGTYALCHTTPSAYDVKLPNTTLGAGGELSASLPREGVLTIYSRSVQVSAPKVADNRLSFNIFTLGPNASLKIERSTDPANPASWSEAGTVAIGAFGSKWQEPAPVAAQAVFYRAVLL